MSNFLIKAFLLLAFLAAAYAVKCSQISQCVTSGQTDTGVDMATLCRTQGKMMECLEAALADCRVTNPSINLATYEEMAKLAKQNCQGIDTHGGAGAGTDTKGDTSGGAARGNTGSSGTGIPENPTCQDYSRCMPSEIGDKLKNADETDYAAICPSVKPVIKCLSAVIADCKSKDNNNVMMGMIETVLQKTQEGADKHCNGANGITQTTWLLTIFSALALIVARLL